MIHASYETKLLSRADIYALTRSKKTTQTMGNYLAKFDLLRRRAESRMQPGGTSPEASVSVS